MPLSEQMRADGWIEHDGGECPVAPDANVLAIGPDPLRDQFEGSASENNWFRTVAYRTQPDERGRG